MTHYVSSGTLNSIHSLGVELCLQHQSAAIQVQRALGQWLVHCTAGLSSRLTTTTTTTIIFICVAICTFYVYCEYRQ